MTPGMAICLVVAALAVLLVIATCMLLRSTWFWVAVNALLQEELG